MDRTHVENSQNVIAGSTVNANGDILVNGQKITNYFYSAQYQDLKNQREKLETRFSKTKQKTEKYPQEEDFRIELLQIDEERNSVQKKLDDLKSEVIRLAEIFAGIPINTERLKSARQHFEMGDYARPGRILDAKEMASELDVLLHQREQLKRDKAENDVHLIDKANEFLILAHLTAVNYTQTDRYAKTAEYFEQSLKAAHTAENTFAYAHFLQQHNQFNVALSFYLEALEIYRSMAEDNPEGYLPHVAMTLNNLAVLQTDKNEFVAAEGAYQEALTIRRRLAEINPQAYMPDVAQSLNNLARLQQAKNELNAAEAGYQEALTIRRRLAGADPDIYLPTVAATLNNLGALQTKKNELAAAEASFQEALIIFRRLAEDNPQAYLPDVAGRLNNLANVHKAKNEPAAAEAGYQEALVIYRSLAEINPQTYLPYIAMTAVNMSVFFQQAGPDREKSLAYAKEAWIATLPDTQFTPAFQNYRNTASQVAEGWGLDKETFCKEPAKGHEELESVNTVKSTNGVLCT